MAIFKSKSRVILTHAAFTPVNSTTYTFGVGTVAPVANGSPYSKVYPFQKGVIRSVHFQMMLNNGKASSSSENVAVYLRLNNTTDYTITTTADFGGSSRTNRQYTVTNLNVPLTTSDFIEAKVVTPAWATPPISVVMTMVVIIDSY